MPPVMTRGVLRRCWGNQNSVNPAAKVPLGASLIPLSVDVDLWISAGICDAFHNVLADTLTRIFLSVVKSVTRTAPHDVFNFNRHNASNGEDDV